MKPIGSMIIVSTDLQKHQSFPCIFFRKNFQVRFSTAVEIITQEITIFKSCTSISRILKKSDQFEHLFKNRPSTTCSSGIKAIGKCVSLHGHPWMTTLQRSAYPCIIKERDWHSQSA